MDAFVDFVAAHPDASFYRDHWGGESSFEALPETSRSDFLKTPLSKRRYKDEKALIKTVRTKEGLFASEWSFSDIAQESWGPCATRPLIYFADPDEAVEKSMWCYERNILPLIGEAVPDITNSAAEFYRINSAIVDAPSLALLLPYLRGRAEPLESISIVGSSFTISALQDYVPYAKDIQLVLSLPETGAFAQAPLASRPVFTLNQNCFIEPGESGLLLTKNAKLVTPIIRYVLDGVAGDTLFV